MKIEIIKYIEKLLPDIKLQEGDSFSWSPNQQLITYKPKTLDQIRGKWAILHEASHAILDHSDYKSDMELLQLEAEAWSHAKKIAKTIKIDISEDHIQDCLDTYRDWLYRRSTCPKCGLVCLQLSPTEYSCHNCSTTWTVTAARFCRPYRLKVQKNKEKRLPVATTFS